MIYIHPINNHKTDGSWQMLDMMVVGAGYVGLAAAVAVKQAAPHLNIEVVEEAPAHVWEKDERASAIITAASKMLAILGVWDEILVHSQPINRMIVTDSRTAGSSCRTAATTMTTAMTPDCATEATYGV